MPCCDVLIVGGGPAGSSCAWALRRSGLRVAILDKASFPRDKICGGWITPEVLNALRIEASEYGRRLVLQPITGFRVGCIAEGRHSQTEYGTPVSYGIRRREFDQYLLERCAAEVHTETAFTSLERQGSGWIVNGSLQARLVVGAGGHFCPVARRLNPRGAETEVVVAAQETEFELNAEQQRECPVRGAVPELYFCSDLKGYGWCFRKGNVLNIGLGRADRRRLPEHVQEFLQFLKTSLRVSLPVPALGGHAYLLYGTSPRNVVGDGFLLIGDAAGLAFPQSGEGILPAIESGLLAAETILAAGKNYAQARLEPYRQKLALRFGGANQSWMMKIGRNLPSRLIQFASSHLLANPRFVRNVVLDRWFLHQTGAQKRAGSARVLTEPAESN